MSDEFVNAGVEARPAPRAPAQPQPPPTCRPARFEDFEALSRLWMAQGWHVEPAGDWRAFWLDNPIWPRVGTTWPIGWVLEDAAGKLVGTHTNIPSLYMFRGQELVCASSRAWAVEPAFRGYALWLIEEYYNQPAADICISTSAGPQAVPVIEQLARRVPLGNWQKGAYWRVGYRDLVRNKLAKKRVRGAELLSFPAAALLHLQDALSARPLPRLPQGFSIEQADSFDTRFDAFGQDLIRQNPEKLIAVRNRRVLSWHFRRPMREGRLRIFTASHNRQLRAYCVFIHRRGVGTFFLADYQTLEAERDLLGGLLRAALHRCADEGGHCLENYGFGVPKMRIFDQCAPHRRVLPSWRFFYRAADPALDAGLCAPGVWDPSVFDGDTTLT